MRVVLVTAPNGGVHGIPLTPDGKVVLVILSYATGWRLPGGGRKAGEDPREAIFTE
jgi:8-oxo-dGTP pyrophosphatase MutT (NUDIX family)